MVEKTGGRSWQGGFTLVELLAVTAAMIILLGLSAVAMAHYVRVLKITELDNAAREIYMAAENRAVLLSGRGRLEGLVMAQDRRVAATLSAGGGGAAGGAGTYYAITQGDAVLAELLPAGSISPALREGCFYIFYEPQSGSVTDVFYAEGEMEAPDLQAFYEVWSTASRDARMRSDPMIGYYGGGLAQADNIGALFTPVIEIRNEETLRVTVTYKVPSSVANKTDLTVNLTYNGCTVTLPREDSPPTYDGSYSVFTCTWLLDSLEEGRRFAGLFQLAADRPASFGGDFTVTAGVSYGGSYSTASATDNSLFAKGSGGDTAYVGYLRHLQNLDAGISCAAGKTAAVQIADINCAAAAPGYEFVPIENEALACYDGDGYEIRNLAVTEASAAGKPGAGLFAKVLGTGSSPWRFSNVRLVNAAVKPGNGYTVGALAGFAKDTAFDSCWVYWEAEAGEPNLRSLLGDDVLGYEYQIAGRTAGGLAGRLEGGTINNCLAASLVEGSVSAGGLLGSASGTVLVENSYAGCYLTGDAVAGLIGSSGTDSGILTLENCYAAGFSQAGKTAAGLCMSTVRSATNVYSVMRYSGLEAEKIVPLCGSGSGMANAHYLKISDADSGDSYSEMIGDGFAAAMGGAFQWKSHSESSPYNLRTGLNLDIYSFPGLTGLPHYGDWGAQFNDASLVYYEQYEDGSYGFQGGNVDCLRDDKAVLLDGYAVALLKADLDSAASAGLDIAFQYQDGDGTAAREAAYPKAGLLSVEDTYCLAPLPEGLVNSTYTSKAFYQLIIFSYTLQGEEKTGMYAYSPHFAGTAVAVEEPEDGGQPAIPGTDGLAVSVRTPRHLYMLGHYPDYFSGRYSFRQELDLDYSTYTGYSGQFCGAPFAQAPIGRDSALPFNGTYDGRCYTIENVVFTVPNSSYAGLFGYSSGTLRNIVYLMPDCGVSVSRGGSSGLYVGGLAGGNVGVLTNCAAAGVRLSAMSYSGTVYLGGLAGQNSGLVQNCGAEAAAVSASGSTYGRVYAGGLVGANSAGGIIARSYAVGRAAAEADRTSHACLGGFAASNRGYIAHCYAGLDLSSSGDQVAVFGFCDPSAGERTGDFYLNVENFTYRDKAYNATYAGGAGITGVRYAGLTGGTSPVSGMSMGVYAYRGGEYPYPSAVQDAKGRPVHYGQWPERMNLGGMGIYYWEKLEIGGQSSYNVSLLAVDTDHITITKQTTLSTARDDGGVVTDYGYGYYCENPAANATTLSAGDLYYSSGGRETPFSPSTTASDREVDAALETLMTGYTFHSYHTFGLGEDGGGLYPASQNGTLILRQAGQQVEFAVSPFFADSMAVKNPVGWEEPKAPTATPGMAENPYGVRSVEQLRFINWNTDAQNTSTVMEMAVNYDKFPYLSHDGFSGKYCWVQSHDLNGSGKAYTPIAEYYDTSTGNQGRLYGWFGGSFDGDSYLIQDVNIKGQTSSCAGLFGVVYNGTLKNIVMYCADGKGTVTSAHSTGTNGTGTKSLWYGIGCLAGLAASDSGSAVQNCAVAGYTVHADVYTATGGWGGSGIGGLLGISNMSLEGCTAVTDIVIPDTATDNDNMRVGGLVGTCQGSITNCYAGGEIAVAQKSYANGIYIGGIVGGSYFKPLQPQGGTMIGVIGSDQSGSTKNTTNNALSNCYSYVTLPASADNPRIKSLYALGGTGDVNSAEAAKQTWDQNANHGICTITNCFYLESWVLSNSGGSAGGITLGKTDVKNTAGVTALPYAELAAGTAMCERLGGAYAPVTSTENGFSIAGKYSYAPGNRMELMGLDYPFPTVLTREGGTIHVHYGEWPLNGIQREKGGEPVELDLFVQPEITEQLTLSARVPPNGTWSVAIQEERDEQGDALPAIVEAAVTQAGGGASLAVTATGAGVGTAALTVRYQTGNTQYALNLTVNVTAVLELRPENPPVKLFTNDTAAVELLPYGKGGRQLSLEEEGIELALEAPAYDAAYIGTAGMDASGKSLILTSLGLEGITGVSLSFQYSYKGQAYPATGSAVIQLAAPVVDPPAIGIELPAGGEPSPDGDTGSAVVCFGEGAEIKEAAGQAGDSAIAAGLALSAVGGRELTVTVTGLAPGETTVKLDVKLEMDGRAHAVKVEIPVTVREKGSGTEEGTNPDGGDKAE